MKSTHQWITYRTRFLVKAKQLTASLAFTDDLGRIHSGRKGDYLVESSEGVLSIAPRQIFEDVYVSLRTGQNDNSARENSPLRSAIPTGVSPSRREGEAKWRACPEPVEGDQFFQPRSTPLPTHLTRKSPQPYRDRPATHGLRSL